MSSQTSYEEVDLKIDFKNYWQIIKRHWFPGVCVFGTVVALSFVASLLETPTYEASGRILVREPRETQFVGINVDPRTDDPLEPLGRQSDALVTEIELIRSYPVVEETVRAIALTNDDYQELDPGKVLKNLMVSSIPESDVFAISYESPDPELAAAIVNNVIEVYTERSIITNRAEATAAREFITQQLPETEAAVNLAAEELAQFKRQNNVVNLPEQELQVVRSISNLQNLVSTAQTDLADITAQSSALQQQLGMNIETALQASALSQSPSIQDTLQQLRQVRSQLDAERSRYSSEYPTVATLERQEAATLERLRDLVQQVGVSSAEIPSGMFETGPTDQQLIQQLAAAEAQRSGLTQRVRELAELEAFQRAEANKYPQVEKVQQELERRLNVAQTTYESLLLRLQEVQVTENQTIGNVRVVEKAQVPTEAITSKDLFIGAGIVGGGLLGLATIFLLGLFDQSVPDTRKIDSKIVDRVG